MSQLENDYILVWNWILFSVTSGEITVYSLKIKLFIILFTLA